MTRLYFTNSPPGSLSDLTVGLWLTKRTVKRVILLITEENWLPWVSQMSFICMRRKNDFHIKGWAPTLVLKQRSGGYAGVRVEMIVEVHSGTVLEDAFSIWRQICPPRKCHNALWQPFRPGFSRNLKVANKSYLSHSGEESLRIEEACHPEHIRSSFKTPIPKLTVSFQKFGVPESKRGRLPWDLKSDEIKWKKNNWN